MKVFTLRFEGDVAQGSDAGPIIVRRGSRLAFDGPRDVWFLDHVGDGLRLFRAHSFDEEPGDGALELRDGARAQLGFVQIVVEERDLDPLRHELERIGDFIAFGFHTFARDGVRRAFHKHDPTKLVWLARQRDGSLDVIDGGGGVDLAQLVRIAYPMPAPVAAIVVRKLYRLSGPYADRDVLIGFDGSIVPVSHTYRGRSAERAMQRLSLQPWEDITIDRVVDRAVDRMLMTPYVGKPRELTDLLAHLFADELQAERDLLAQLATLDPDGVAWLLEQQH